MTIIMTVVGEVGSEFSDISGDNDGGYVPVTERLDVQNWFLRRLARKSVCDELYCIQLLYLASRERKRPECVTPPDNTLAPVAYASGSPT